MDFMIETSGILGEMTFEPAENVLNNIYLSLAIPRGSLFCAAAFGSRLHLLARSKNTPEAAALAKDYCLEALQWLIDCGRVVSIDIAIERNPEEDPHRLKAHIQAVQADQTVVTFDTFQEVV